MRECEICGVKINEGYVHEELGMYFCCDEHLDQKWEGTVAELNSMSEDELEESVIYWTEWEED